ncbi:MAG: hypothetical protein KIT14_00135 [bacterium]|nr:hypothetical protein [bacterium]
MADHEWLTPIVEVIPGSEAAFVPEQMGKSWRSERPYFIDGLFLDDEDWPDDDAEEHPIFECFQEVASRQQAAIPITGTGRSEAYQEAVATIARDQGRGCGLRLVRDDFDDEDELEAIVAALLERVGLDAPSVDVFIDLGSVAGERSAAVTSIMRATLDLVPRVSEWRTLTVLSGAFPLGLGPLVSGTWNAADRSDWGGWRRVVSRPDRVPRLPSYGDYGIGHPDLPPTGRATILAQLRYSIDTQFMIWKGGNVFKQAQGYGQFLAICRNLIRQQWYDGRTFSAADAEIYEKATVGGSPGNAETWRRIGLNHHLEKVRAQLASLPVP